VLHLDELVWGENGWTELGEKLFDPQVECLFLDPLFLANVNHDSGDNNAGMLVLDGLFISISIGESIGIVAKRQVGGIGSLSNRNWVIRHFLVKFGPFKVGLLDDTMDLRCRESTIFMHGLGLGSAHLD